MTYKKNDILIFMTNEPQAHVCEMFGHRTTKKKEEIEKEPYYGFVKSVISAKDGIYLMRTLKPMGGFICIATAADIVRLVDKNELSEEDRERKPCEWMEAPNVYIPANDADYSTLTEQEHCIALAKEALQHLFPKISVVSFEFDQQWFSKNGFVTTLKYLDEEVEQIKDSGTKKELEQMKNEILKDVETARFKEYFTVKVSTQIEEEGIMKGGVSFFTIAVSKEFDEVCILRDINERSNFFRSLGPEFNDLEEAVSYCRDKVMEAYIAMQA